MGSRRVLFVYGSETGQTQAEVKQILKGWEGRGLGKVTVDQKVGNDIAKELDFSEIKEKYDVILVGTSSFGDGDPPRGFDKFLGKLYAARRSADPQPLAGMEHCVLGFGSTDYPTFQNCPRLTDRLLEEAGARRFLQRVEVDDNEKEAVIRGKVKAWEEKVFDFLQAPKGSDTKAVCPWTEPASQIEERDVSTGSLASSGSGPNWMMIVLLVAAAFAFAVNQGIIPREMLPSWLPL